MTSAEQIADVVIRHTQNSLRVDRHHGACAWFRVRSDHVQALSLREVWQLAYHRAGINRVPGTATDFALAIRLVQERAPLLTEDEWRNITPARKAA